MNGDDFLTSESGDFTQSQCLERDFYYAGGFYRTPRSSPASFFGGTLFDAYPDEPTRPASAFLETFPAEQIVIPDNYKRLAAGDIDTPQAVGPTPPVFAFTGISPGSWMRLRVRVWGIMPLVDPWTLPPFEAPPSLGGTERIYKTMPRLWLINDNATPVFDPIFGVNRTGFVLNAIGSSPAAEPYGLWELDRVITFYGQLTNTADNDLQLENSWFQSLAQLQFNNGLAETIASPGTAGHRFRLGEPNTTLRNPRNPIPLDFVAANQRSEFRNIYFESAGPQFLNNKIFRFWSIGWQIIDSSPIATPDDTTPQYLDNKVELVSQLQDT